MKRLLVILSIISLFHSFAFAQKKEISQAQTYVKTGKNLDKAEASMRKLLADSANHANIKIWHTLTEAIRLQYEQANEQLYLKQKFDTASLFSIELRMFQAYEAMDSVDAQPDDKGRVTIKYRKRNAEYLSVYRKNLYNGGVFFLSKQNYKSAFNLFDAFLDCVNQPLFSNNKLSMSSPSELSAAYLATYCGVKLGKSDLALKYSSSALGYKPGREKTLQFLANIYSEKKDTVLYRESLKTGFDEYPQNEFFFTRLVDFYNGKNQIDSANVVIDKALMADSVNTLFLYAKSNLLLNMGEYGKCVSICDSLIARNDTLADAYYNAGVAYMNMAFKAEGKSQMKKYYKCSLPYMERYRELAPDQKDKWAAALYNIYLNLNMGKKFEEIVGILKK